MSSPPVRPAAPAWARPILVLLAVLFLVEAWLWRHLGPLVRRCADLIPFARLKALAARWVERLPPYAALAVFLIPLLVVEPLNGVALWAFAHREWSAGVACLVAEKLLGVGLMAFLYDVCARQLRSIGWFAAMVDFFFHLKAWAEAEVAPLKARIREAVRRIAGGGGFLARIAALRRRIFSRF
ncbi:hypothetical protein [Aquabacter spiritensis]|uniref:Uncharacterized protein n=1 Tax=Aquabacter spiritensis TaxID=933073 RepID=A0A4V2UYP2_9HYPH|nr:hypothetical protein [Aquabacter spiritensis]TCT08238.1 hypothetical protein EDC64_101760 [Aquabacter spiritensis]